MLMTAVLSRSAFNRARNAARGMLASACSSRSMRDSGIGALHAPPQRLQRAELKLFDGAFRLAEAPGDVADAAALDVALDDHRPLIGGQGLDEREHAREALDALDVGLGALLRHQIGSDRLAGPALPAVGDHVR